MTDRIVLTRDKDWQKHSLDDADGNSSGKIPPHSEGDLYPSGQTRPKSHTKVIMPGRGRGEHARGASKYDGEKWDKRNGAFTDKKYPSKPYGGHGKPYQKSYEKTYERPYEKSYDKPPRRFVKSQEYTSSEYTKKDYISKLYAMEPPIARLVKQLHREEGRDLQMASARALLDYLCRPPNAKGARKVGETLWVGVADFLAIERVPKDVKAVVVNVLALCGQLSLLFDKGTRFINWMYSKIDSTNSNWLKFLYIQTLSTFISGDEITSTTIKVFVEQMLTLLESVDDSELLKKTSEMAILVAELFPDEFSPNFSDIVDILIGWHIESAHSSGVTKVTSVTFVSLKKFWVSDGGAFGRTLLTQFLDDMEAYKEDLCKLSEESDNGKEMTALKQKIESFLSIFSTVVTAMAPESASPDGTSTTGNDSDFLSQNVCRLINCVRGVLDVTPSTSLFLLTNECLSSLLHHFLWDLTTCSTQLNSFSLLQLNKRSLLKNYESFASLTNVVVKIINNSKNRVDIEFAQALLSSELPSQGVNPTCRASLEATQEVFKALLSVKQVKVLQDTYRYLLDLMNISFSILNGNQGDEASAADQSTKHAEASILFVTQTLTPVATDTSNLIFIYSVSPSIFSHLCSMLRPSACPWVVRNSSSYRALLSLLYSHCTSHKFFIGSSSWVVHKGYEANQSEVLSQTAKYLQQTVTFIKELLLVESLGIVTRCLLYKWTAELLQTVAEKATPVIGQDLVQSLIGICAHQDLTAVDEPLILAFCQFYETIVGILSLLPPDLSIRVFHFCKQHIGEQYCTVSERCLDILSRLPLTTVSRCQTDFQLLDAASLSQIKLRRSMMAKFQVSFNAEHFRSTMIYILKGTLPGEDLTDWLAQVYRTSQKSGGLSELSSPSSSVLWYWAIWQSANFTVQSRLRTPIGKPQETFTALESCLKRLANQVKDAKGLNYVFDVEELERVDLLLAFMESLEKLMYNAYEGCVNTLPPPTRPVRTFFRTNKSTCVDWLTRLRLIMMRVAAACGQPNAVVRHGTELLLDMKKNNNTKAPELEGAVVLLVEAFVELRCPEEIYGLHRWCKTSSTKQLFWIKPSADLAQGRYKQAAKGFEESLERLGNDNEISTGPTETGEGSGFTLKLLSKPDPVVVEHCLKSLLSCSLHLHDWAQLGEVLNEAPLHLGACGPTTSGLGQRLASTLPYQGDTNLISAMASYSSGDLAGAFTALCREGAALEQVAREATPLEVFSWDVEGTANSNRKQIYKSALHFAEKNDFKTLERSLRKSHAVVTSLLTGSSQDWPKTISLNLFNQLLMGNILLGKNPQEGYWRSPDQITCPDVDLLLDCGFALKVKLLSEANSGDYGNQVAAVQLAAIKTARKQGNLELSQRLLLDQFAPHGSNFMNRGSGSSSEGVSLRDLVCRKPVSHASVSVAGLTADREAAKLLHVWGDSYDAAVVLSHSTTSFLLTNHTASSQDYLSCSELATRSLLTLTKWFQNDPKMLTGVTNHIHSKQSADQAHVLAKNIKTILSTKTLGMYMNPVLSDEERLVGALLSLSTCTAPRLPKAWFQLGGWCYKWGRRALDVASQGHLELTQQEEEIVLETLPADLPQEEVDGILGVIKRLHAHTQSEEDISDQGHYDDGTETLTKLLQQESPSLQPGLVNQLVEIWKIVVRRVYFLYMESANSYFKYLKLDHGMESDNITATLRLLRLLVKHAWELREVLEQGLASTSTAPWKAIIPQLFSRLSHPESYVRQSVSDLLGRLALDAPHLIVYPAVVGSLTSSGSSPSRGSDLMKTCLQQISADEGVTGEGGASGEGGTSGEDGDRTAANAETDREANTLKDCFDALVGKLAENNPTMITEVKLLTEELCRITVLWDELWLGTLNQLAPLVQDRLAQLTQEVKKSKANESLSWEERLLVARSKHRALLAQSLLTLERLAHMTIEQPATTSHERWFQNLYSHTITNALERLRNPVRPEEPTFSWFPFKMFHQSLQQRAQKKSSLSLRLEDVSQRLASFQGSAVAMPGLGASQGPGGGPGGVVTVASLCSAVTILPTKTKPKKLLLVGSDGKRYAYLFKGLEDLHLDERIMQFLAIVNSMLQANNKSDRPGLRSRHYSVTPLGLHSGLIQWVDGSSPLFTIYKRWQMRNTAVQQQAPARLPSAPMLSSGVATPGASNPPTLHRPSELFFSRLMPKLRPLFPEKTPKEIEKCRNEWPLEALVATLKELIDDTPSDLVAREIWCSSSGSKEWFSVTQSFSRSLAVMSMIGHIIGLGDRHLDNLLLDTMTGEIVHIDYNVCFDKGKSLRVPETIPFRLTQNLERALGVTGVEGTYRGACEQTLKVMRRGRETLLTLLEAFVYDPLVDWTVGGEAGLAGAAAFQGGVAGQGADHKAKKKDLERESACTMFAVRTLEIRNNWMKNKEELSKALTLLREEGQGLLELQATFVKLEQQREEMKNLKVMATEAVNNDSHALHTLPNRYTKYMRKRQQALLAKEGLKESIVDCEKWHIRHQAIGDMFGSSPALKMLAGNISKPLSVETSTYLLVQEFLHSAGQNAIVPQCINLAKELETTLNRRRSVMKSCVESIHTYASIVSQLPLTYFGESRSTQHMTLLKQLVHDFTAVRCRTAQENLQSSDLTSDKATGNAALVVASSDSLQGALSELQVKHERLMERAAQEKTSSDRLMNMYTESKTALRDFACDSKPVRRKGMFCCTITHLMSLAKKLLLLEGAAQGAGDQLPVLTSRDGDWFLDDLASISENIVEFLSNAKECLASVDTKPALSDGGTEVRLWHLVPRISRLYATLDKINADFRSIILPETVKHLQRRQGTVISILDWLEEGQVLHLSRLQELDRKCERALTDRLIGKQGEDESLGQSIQQLRDMFDKEMTSARGASSKTPGHLLMLGFDGLFQDLALGFTELSGELLRGFEVPNQWKKINIVKEAKSLQMIIINEATLPMIVDILFIKKLIVMSSFFSLCQSHVSTVQNGYAPKGQTSVLSDESLSKPFRVFVAYFVRRHLLGVSSQTLGYLLCCSAQHLGLNVEREVALKDIGASFKVSAEELCKKAVDSYVKAGHTLTSTLGQANNFIKDFDTKWKRLNIAMRLGRNLNLVRSSLTRRQKELAAFQWTHEEALVSTGKLSNQGPLPSTILVDIKRNLQMLSSLESVHSEVLEKLTSVESNVCNRLRWAAGANPVVGATLSKFENMQRQRLELVQREHSLLQHVGSISSHILHFEGLRKRTAESVAVDDKFKDLLSRCLVTCVEMESLESAISSQEMSIMSNMTPVDIQSAEWLSLLLAQANSMQDEFYRQKVASQDQVRGHSESIKSTTALLQNQVLSSHHRLISEVRSVLKSLAKLEESRLGDRAAEGPVNQFMVTYKSFTEALSRLMKASAAVTTHQGDTPTLLVTALDSVSAQVDNVYTSLLMLAKPLKESEDEENKSNHSETEAAVKKSVERVTRDPRTGKAVQEKNSYAVGVWRRVKMKLDGRESETSRRLTVQEQVHGLIEEALSADNLSHMYEGWTAWV